MTARKKKLNAISLYTGAGGLDYGFEAAGVHTAAAIEKCSQCGSRKIHSRPELYPGGIEAQRGRRRRRNGKSAGRRLSTASLIMSRS
jgi:hypothetical protein